MIAGHKNAAMLVSILFAALLILVSIAPNCGEVDFKNLESILPSPVDMTTSPLALRVANNDLEAKPAAQAAEKQLDVSQSALNAAMSVPIEPAPKAVKADAIVISKIAVEAPIVTAKTIDSEKLHGLLDSGAVLYPDSAMFGNSGQTILLGHSAPANWPKIKHDTIFSRIVELVPGDKIVTVYQNRTYNYTVVDNQIIDKGANVPSIANADNSLVLLTCWPPGRDQKRVVVQAALDYSKQN